MGRVDVRAWAAWQGFVVDSGTGTRDGQVGEEEEDGGGEERWFGPAWCAVAKSGLEDLSPCLAGEIP